MPGMIAEESCSHPTDKLQLQTAQQQLPHAQSGIHMAATAVAVQEAAHTPAHHSLQHAAMSAAQNVATVVAAMQLADASDGETTMCLRSQLIHSRCTDSR